MNSISQDNCTLLPCPFCGGAAEMDTQRGYITLGAFRRLDSAVAIYCVDCGADHSICRADHRGVDTDILVAEVTAAWNKRATPPVDMEGAVKMAVDGALRFIDRTGNRAYNPDYFTAIIRAALSAVSALQRTEWQPMTTAPRDGTDFLAYLGDPPTGDQMVIFYDKPSADAPSHCWHRADGLAYHWDLPKFWQPLPAAPVLADDRSK